MKYIRTKEGIFDKVDETLVLASKPPKYDLCKNGEHIKYEFCHNCKLADTIEELCDEFIVVHENGTHVIQKKVGNGLKDMDEDYPKYLERNNQVFYGAIWTEWGLKYVAKMNEKGKLELL